jgi:hypothetical protein
MNASGIEFLLAYASWAEVPPSVGTLGRTWGVFISFTYVFCPYGTLNRTELTFFSTRLKILQPICIHNGEPHIIVSKEEMEA